MNPIREQLYGYEKYLGKQQQQWERNEKPLLAKSRPWELIKQMMNDCERLHTDDEETAEMLLDFVRELMTKEIPDN